VRTVAKTERKESFFHWFDPPEMPPMDTMDEEEADRLEEEFDSDYEIAQAFRNHVIPKAVLWFSGEVRTLTHEGNHLEPAGFSVSISFVSHVSVLSLYCICIG
jgi:hypothetical protein